MIWRHLSVVAPLDYRWLPYYDKDRPKLFIGLWWVLASFQPAAKKESVLDPWFRFLCNFCTFIWGMSVCVCVRVCALSRACLLQCILYCVFCDACVSFCVLFKMFQTNVMDEYHLKCPYCHGLATCCSCRNFRHWTNWEMSVLIAACCDVEVQPKCSHHFPRASEIGLGMAPKSKAKVALRRPAARVGRPRRGTWTIWGSCMWHDVHSFLLPSDSCCAVLVVSRTLWSRT